MPRQARLCPVVTGLRAKAGDSTFNLGELALGFKDVKVETSVNLQELGFTDLLDIYQTRAEELGQEPDDSFKTKEALVDAINKLASRPEGGNGAEPPGGDNSKYNSTGKRGPNQGVGAFAKEQIALGKSNTDILDMIREQFPTARTSMNCVAYYRNSLKKGGTAAGPKGGNPEALRAKAKELLEQADRLEKAMAEALTRESIEAKVREEVEARIRQEVEARYQDL